MMYFDNENQRPEKSAITYHFQNITFEVIELENVCQRELVEHLQ